MRLLVASLMIPGFTLTGRLAIPNSCNEAVSGSLYITARILAITGLRTKDYSNARPVGYMSYKQLHGKLLSSCWINQAY